MGKQFRNSEEKAEALENKTSAVPDSKYQDDQQVAKSTGFKVETGKSTFVPEKKKAAGSTLKQEVAASVIKDASYGGSLSGDGMSFNGAKSSGSVGGILGAANSTPVAGQSRSDSRTSKKLDRNSTKLNFIPSDQVLVEWDESKPLADAADLDQGFNGTYRNEYARTQKNKEAVPGGLMFDRSLDLIVKDNIYFGEGQKIKQTGVSSDEDLRVTAAPDANGIYTYPASNNYDAGITGNYLNGQVNILFNDDGRPIYTEYEDVDLSESVDQYEANKSSAQNHILMNDAEIVRETMDTKAGDEKADIWTPLARAVAKPTQVAGFLRDLEANVGNEVMTAYRKASTSMSFQLNRAHKDGQNVIDPIIFALTGLDHNYVSSAAAQSDQGSNIQDLFTTARYRRGESQTIVALYDSVGKYNSKADFLVQPRGFRMHLQTADNNMDPLRVNKLFNNVYDQQEVFSTIDREYDPMSPICMTDKANVIHRLSWHKLGSYMHSAVEYTLVDKEKSDVAEFILIPKRMVKEIKDHGYNIYFIYPKDANGDIEYTQTGKITQESLYNQTGKMSMFIAESAPTYDSTNYELLTISNTDILTTTGDLVFDGSGNTNHKLAIKKAVIIPGSTKIYAYKGGDLFYKYSDLRNVYVTKVSDYLTRGIDKYFEESIGSKFARLLTDGSGYVGPVAISTVHSTMFFSLWSFIICAATPWIIKERINSMRDVLYYEKNVEYPFGSTLAPISEIKTKAYSNFSYVNYDTELSCSLMKPSTAITWILPEVFQQVGYDGTNTESAVLCPWYTNQSEIEYIDGSYQWDDDASAMSFPSIRSGVRLGALDTLYGMSEKDVRLCLDKISSFKNLSPTLSRSKTYKYSSVADGQLILAINTSTLTVEDFMSLPREMGFFMTAPYGTLTPNYNDQRFNDLPIGNSSFRTYYWFGANPTTTDDQGTQSILSTVTINVNRGQNFTQEWYCVLASGTIPPVDHGFVLSASSAFTQKGALLLGRSKFTPYTNLTKAGNGPVSSNMNPMRSLQKVYWTRIQKLPFVISPFDLLAIDNTDSPNNVVVNDIFDLCYFLGLGGFRASDFRESVYNREKEVVNQGMLFTSDPWIEDSPIFKDGAASSGITNTKGFEM